MVNIFVFEFKGKTRIQISISQHFRYGFRGNPYHYSWKSIYHFFNQTLHYKLLTTHYTLFIEKKFQDSFRRLFVALKDGFVEKIVPISYFANDKKVSIFTISLIREPSLCTENDKLRSKHYDYLFEHIKTLEDSSVKELMYLQSFYRKLIRKKSREDHKRM